MSVPTPELRAEWRRWHSSWVEFGQAWKADQLASTVSLLLDALDAAEAERDQMQARLERVAALADGMDREAPKPQVGGFIAEEIRNALRVES